MANLSDPKEHAFAISASYHDAGATHVSVRFGKPPFAPQLRTLSFRSRSVHDEYSG